MVLGITNENITLPGSIHGWLNSRSRFARMVLMLYITAPFIQPGDSGRHVFEIYNVGPNNLELVIGERLCRIIFQQVNGEAFYEGQFNNQKL